MIILPVLQSMFYFQYLTPIFLLMFVSGLLYKIMKG